MCERVRETYFFFFAVFFAGFFAAVFLVAAFFFTGINSNTSFHGLDAKQTTLRK
jgi:hypothetical protein